MTALKLTQIDDPVSLILPEDLLTRLKLEKCDPVILTEAAKAASCRSPTTPTSSSSWMQPAPS